MNIFYLDEDPKICAHLHCDKHVVKMCTEYAQLLSTAHRLCDGTEWIETTDKGRKIKRWRLDDENMENTLYKACHVNHPSAIWTRASGKNYLWLYRLFSETCHEYTHRYNKRHASWDLLWKQLATPPLNISWRVDFNEPTPAMKKYPQCIVAGDSIQSYKNYYQEAKRSFAKWTNRPTPEFML